MAQITKEDEEALGASFSFWRSSEDKKPKPESNLGSPVSHLQTQGSGLSTATNSSCSSSSSSVSGSVPGQNAPLKSILKKPNADRGGRSSSNGSPAKSVSFQFPLPRYCSEVLRRTGSLRLRPRSSTSPRRKSGTHRSPTPPGRNAGTEPNVSSRQRSSTSPGQKAGTQPNVSSTQRSSTSPGKKASPQPNVSSRQRSSTSPGKKAGKQPTMSSGQGSGTGMHPIKPGGSLFPSGQVVTTGMATSTGPTTLGPGSGYYGYGSVMWDRNAPVKLGSRKKGSGYDGGVDSASEKSEQLKESGNYLYQQGRYVEALEFYDRAVSISPRNPTYRRNRAAALIALGRVTEAVSECEVAGDLDPTFPKAPQRSISYLLRLGQVENVRKQFQIPSQKIEPADIHQLQCLEKHIFRCDNARKVGNWRIALKEADFAIVAGADLSPQLFMCRVEALLKLHQYEEAESSIKNVPKSDSTIDSCTGQTRFFGMLSEAYLHFVRAQLEMAMGRFDDAVSAAEKAGEIDPQNSEVAGLVKNVKLVAQARSRGNDLFKSERFTEACTAYDQGLRLDPSNSVLYCNRAACWDKLGRWERSIDDCNHALNIQQNYTKALLRRAAANFKLERWADAVSDYESLRLKLPDDMTVAESLFLAHVSLRKSRGEEVLNLKFGGDVENVVNLEQFKAAVSFPGVSVVHFNSASNLLSEDLSEFCDTLCRRYPTINFLKVVTEECREVASSENITIVPVFKIYKNGNRVKQIVCPSRAELERSVKVYSFI